MKVLLIKDVSDLGHVGDIVDVADGYGRNYLLPRNLAVKASGGAMKHAERMKAARVEAESKALADAEEMAKALRDAHVVVAARAGDEGKLFGSIGTGDVAEAVKTYTGIDLDRQSVHLSEPIRSIGLHQVDVNLHADVRFPITIDVVPA